MRDAVAFWENPGKLAKARAYYSRRLDHVAPFGGLGFPQSARAPRALRQPGRAGN